MNSKSTLLVIGPTPPPYHGVAVAIQSLLQSDLRKEFNVIHLELADRRGINHVNNPDFHDVLLFLRQWLRLLATLSRDRPTTTYLVLSQTTIGVFRDSLLIWPVLLARSRVVAHLHGGHFRAWYDSRASFMKIYVRTMLSLIHCVIVLGDSLRSQFDDLVHSARITVIPNGIENIPFSAPIERPHRSRRYRILHLSTLNHLKGALVLLQAIPIVLDVRQDVEFVFAGPWSDPTDEQLAMKLIDNHQLASFVMFPGQVDPARKQTLLRRADLFVFPGVQQEGQPLVVLEAMAAGLPIIYTNRGCLRETVVDGESGLEVRCNDPDHLADRILWLLAHPEERLQLGKEALHRQQQLFTKKRHVQEMIKTLRLVDNAA